MSWQDLLATLVAAAAFVVVIRRVFGTFRPAPRAAACENCPLVKD